MQKTKTIARADHLAKIPEEVLTGVRVVKFTEDGSYNQLRSITLRDVAGNEVEFCGGDSSNRVLMVVPSPREYERKYKLTGKFLGLEISEFHDEHKDAQHRLNALKEEHDPAANLTIEEVEVEV